MARRGQKDLIGKLADKGEEAISKVADVPAAAKLLQAATGMRERLDEIQKKMRGLDAVEKRLEKLERRVDELTGKKPATKKTTTRKTSTTKRAASPRSQSGGTGGSSPG